ncbi:LEA type 2 family protein [Solilutibacter silvestris]|uniref:Late embryogenesis abundant protein n=1 Tax=Solilutibacter silvestris TaxID=1645665 RepID=A0A2K1PXY7_9GAMM|nr:LEA type 2 family protein [Lysobacter silvestris]PNS07649.1 Late embryogenesis abundant protein [Lysobacter silvestris]
MRSPKSFPIIALAGLMTLLSACASHGGRRISEPTASIQQLTVDARGNWQVQLRLQNYSSVSMRFDAVDLAFEVNGQAAGHLQATPAMSVPAESADTATIARVPDATAKLAMADALASGMGINYTLKGDIKATPEGDKQRSYTIDGKNQLNPVPGLPGVLR